MRKLKIYGIRIIALIGILFFSLPYILSFFGESTQGTVVERNVEEVLKYEKVDQLSEKRYDYKEYIYVDFEVDGKTYSAVTMEYLTKDQKNPLSSDSILLSSSIKVGDKIKVVYKKDNPKINEVIRPYLYAKIRNIALLVVSIFVFIVSFFNVFDDEEPRGKKGNRKKKAKQKRTEPETIDESYYTDKFDINELNLYYNNRFFSFINAVSASDNNEVILEGALLNGFIEKGEIAIIAKEDESYARLEFVRAITSDGLSYDRIDNSFYKYARLVFKYDGDPEQIKCDSILYIEKVE